jgi:hypothetical protein
MMNLLLLSWMCVCWRVVVAKMQLLDGHRSRYGVSFHGNVVQFAVFASVGPLGYRVGHSDENRSGLHRRALV